VNKKNVSIFSLNRFIKWKKGGLRKRFFSYMFLLIVILMGGVFFVVERNNRVVILMEGQKRGLSNALYLAALSKAPLLMYDYTKLEQNVDEVAKEPDVAYAIILDKSGSVVAHSSRDDLIGIVLEDTLSHNANASESQLIQEYHSHETGEEIWDIAYPIIQDEDIKWGTVRIGFSIRTLKMEIARNRRYLLILTIVAIMLAGGAATLLAERISVPIRKLSDRALSISKGNLQEEIILHTGDEIEELSKTFNHMTRDLAKNRDQQKELIDQLSKNNVLLKQEISVREQLEEELIKTERLRALGEMSGGVAHDFNNILGAILGRAQLLLEKVKDTVTRKGIEVIEKAALDGAETVRRIQEFTRIKADNSSFVPMDLNDIIEDAVEYTKTRWKNEAKSKGININVLFEQGDIPSMMGDPAGLREVFTNLIINAIDAMPEGGVIHIYTFYKGNMAVVYVSDNGIGMSSEIKKRTFEPFFTTKGAGGSGLGLSICYGIISRHQGEIAVESIEGEGSTFNIHLPVNLPGKEKPQLITTARNILSARVLVIEDDEEMRAVLSEILIGSGCHVDEAKSGSEGLERFAAGEYDIVLTDLGMEGMSGREVAEEIKKRSPMTPVILITGWGSQITEKEIYLHGVDFIISKPFMIDEVKETVNRAMIMNG
jgi:signal transduction histidine kinase